MSVQNCFFSHVLAEDGINENVGKTELRIQLKLRILRVLRIQLKLRQLRKHWVMESIRIMFKLRMVGYS